jgi:co-chaperonin GroES (HSP10)
MITPFHNKNGMLEFPYRAILDRCFIWPTPAPDKLGKKKIIEIPQEFQQSYQDGTGILLSIGPGFYSQDGKFHATNNELKPGILVQYDKSIPWSTTAIGQDGKEYFVVICGEQDIVGIIKE